MASDSVTGVLEWERGAVYAPRPVVRGGLSVSSRLSETLGWVSPAGVEVRTELRAHGNPPSSLLFINVKLGDVSLLDVALCVPTENIGGSDAVGRRVKDVQVMRARGSLWPMAESPTVDPAPHTVAVIEALCSALELTPAYNMLEAGKDALAAGRLLLSSAGFKRAARSTVVAPRAGMGVEGEVLPDPPMGYGYRRFVGPGWDDPLYITPGSCVEDYSPVYALRWGASGRITGIDGPFGEPGGLRPVVPLGDGTPADPALFEYDTSEGRLAWARNARWTARLELEGGKS